MNDEVKILKQRLETAGKEIIRTGNENLDLKTEVKNLKNQLTELVDKLSKLDPDFKNSLNITKN